MSGETLERAVPRELMAEDPPWRTVPQLVADAAARGGGREFLRADDGSVTFAQADDHTSRLAHVLVDHGVRPGDRVAIMLPNGIAWPLTWLAVLKAGGIAVPVNVKYRESDLEFVLADSGASVLIITEEQRAIADRVRPACLALREIRTLDELAPEIGRAPTHAPEAVPAPNGVANLQYTSGTTGFPKACVLTHDYWIRMGWLTAGLAEIRADDVVLTAQPFSYMDPQWNTMLSLVGGVPLVVLERFSASGFWPDVRRHGATVFYVLGTMPVLLYKQPPSDADRENAVRLVLCSGIVPDLHRAFEERWGAPWREAYGMTESGVDLAVPVEARETVGTGAIGRPIPTKKVRIAGPDGETLPDGERGEIVVRGRPLMRGYWNRNEASATTLRDGWLHTGDLGYRDPDGWFYVVGRLKDMVRRGGENISCAEVEAVLAQHLAVLEVALVPVPDELFGEEPKAFVELRDPADATTETAEELVAFAAERLARFKVPRFVEFVAGFPKTPSERIAKAELKAKPDQRQGTYDARTRAWG